MMGSRRAQETFTSSALNTAAALALLLAGFLRAPNDASRTLLGIVLMIVLFVGVETLILWARSRH